MGPMLIDPDTLEVTDDLGDFMRNSRVYGIVPEMHGGRKTDGYGWIRPTDQPGNGYATIAFRIRASEAGYRHG